METNVMKIHKNGMEISLMDCSKWRITHIGDTTKTILWYPTQRIKVNEDNDGIFTLFNLDTSTPDDGIEASRII